MYDLDVVERSHYSNKIVSALNKPKILNECICKKKYVLHTHTKLTHYFELWNYNFDHLQFFIHKAVVFDCVLPQKVIALELVQHFVCWCIKLQAWITFPPHFICWFRTYIGTPLHLFYSPAKFSLHQFKMWIQINLVYRWSLRCLGNQLHMWCYFKACELWGSFMYSIQLTFWGSSVISG